MEVIDIPGHCVRRTAPKERSKGSLDHLLSKGRGGEKIEKGVKSAQSTVRRVGTEELDFTVSMHFGRSYPPFTCHLGSERPKCMETAQNQTHGPGTATHLGFAAIN
jgi:hypothetical protein